MLVPASALGAILLWAVMCCGQSTSVPLSDALREHLRLERFDIVTSIRGLPLDVRDELQRLFGSRGLDIALNIAEPGTRFQGPTAAVNPKVPLRRLIAAECSLDHCLVYYERGGAAITWHVALLHWTPADTRLESGGLAPARLATIGDAWKALLSGALKPSPGVW
jgi:hypothetical protein